MVSKGFPMELLLASMGLLDYYKDSQDKLSETKRISILYIDYKTWKTNKTIHLVHIIFYCATNPNIFYISQIISILEHKRNISKLRLMSSSVKRIRTESDILRTGIALRCILNFFVITGCPAKHVRLCCFTFFSAKQH